MKFLDIIFHLNCVFMLKFHSNLLPFAFLNFFTLVSSRHKKKTTLASRSTFYIPLARTNYDKFNIRFKLVKRIRNHSKLQASLKVFKIKKEEVD